jgi:hypothetical protein
MYPIRGQADEKLDALFRAFQSACPDPDPGANFMPELWQKIEARQNFTFSLQRFASAFVTAALALSIALGVYMSIPRSTPSTYYSQSYIEALADASLLDTPETVSPVRLDLTDPGR